MTVEVDSDTEALMSFLEDLPAVFDEVIDIATDEMRGSNGVMRKRFERKVGTQRTYKRLKPETIKRKKKKNQKNILVARGTLKGKTLRNMKGKLSGDDIEFSAKVPKYGEYVNEQRRFFSVDGKKGKPMKQDKKELELTLQRSFVKVMRRRRVNYKP